MATVTVNNLDRTEHVSSPGEWTQTHAPAVNTQATCTQAAPAAGKRNVVKSISFTLAGNTTAPAATVATVNLIFGSSGGTAVLSWIVAIPATAGACVVLSLSDLNIDVAAATAVTLEFSAGGGANTLESVSMTGYTRNINAPS